MVHRPKCGEMSVTSLSEICKRICDFAKRQAEVDCISVTSWCNVRGCPTSMSRSATASGVLWIQVFGTEGNEGHKGSDALYEIAGDSQTVWCLGLRFLRSLLSIFGGPLIPSPIVRRRTFTNLRAKHSRMPPAVSRLLN